MSHSDFSSLKLHPDLIENLKTLNYQSMTPIQAQSLPPILEGKDVIAQGQTGSGKTAAFGLGLLQKLNVKRFRIQSLVLCPTRELADQVAKEIRRLGRGIHNIKVLTLCGGSPMGPQIGSLEHGAHIIVGTPGRIEDHLRKERLKLDEVSTLVLDEADRMLEMGFQESLDNIISQTPSDRQTLLFSATFPKKIEAISKNIMKSPIAVTVASTHDGNSIEQHFFNIKNTDRTDALIILLQKYQVESTIVFCNTKAETQRVADTLREAGYSALALHGDLEQKERDQTLARFANKSTSIVVATDVAARGIDIDSLDLVINFHLSKDNEVHTHRIGRTGRSGKRGTACTLISDKETFKLGKLEEYLGETFAQVPLPADTPSSQTAHYPPMTTIQIDGGKKQKVRPGDILGALTGDKGIDGSDVGKIQIFENWSFVAVAHKASKAALKKLSEGQLKGRNFKVRRLK